MTGSPSREPAGEPAVIALSNRALRSRSNSSTARFNRSTLWWSVAMRRCDCIVAIDIRRLPTLDATATYGMGSGTIGIKNPSAARSVAATKVSRFLDAAAVTTSTPNTTEEAATDSHDCPWSQELESAMYPNAFKCHLVVAWTPTLSLRNQDQNESAGGGGAKLSKMFVNANRAVCVSIRTPRTSRPVPAAA